MRCLKEPLVLLAKNRCGAEDGDLLTRLDGLEGGAHRDLGFAVTDVAADEAVHVLWSHISFLVCAMAELIGGFFVGNSSSVRCSRWNLRLSLVGMPRS